ncbi:MAG: PPC domain-containing DNA-binding protein [Thermodesulfobacteriota bacterium]
MKYSEAQFGRVFVIRLEDGDILHESIESLAAENGIKAGALVILGGADKGSRLVVGPEDGRAEAITPMTRVLENVNEVAGTGTLFPDENGQPVLHMHMACGREDKTVTGCVRTGVRVWHVMEAVLFELTDTSAVRKHDAVTGFALLSPDGR